MRKDILVPHQTNPNIPKKNNLEVMIEAYSGKSTPSKFDVMTCISIWAKNPDWIAYEKKHANTDALQSPHAPKHYIKTQAVSFYYEFNGNSGILTRIGAYDGDHKDINFRWNEKLLTEHFPERLLTDIIERDTYKRNSHLKNNHNKLVNSAYVLAKDIKTKVNSITNNTRISQKERDEFNYLLRALLNINLYDETKLIITK